MVRHRTHLELLLSEDRYNRDLFRTYLTPLPQDPSIIRKGAATLHLTWCYRKDPLIKKYALNLPTLPGATDQDVRCTHIMYLMGTFKGEHPSDLQLIERGQRLTYLPWPYFLQGLRTCAVMLPLLSGQVRYEYEHD